jgi:hypothetical protein
VGVLVRAAAGAGGREWLGGCVCRRSALGSAIAEVPRWRNAATSVAFERASSYSGLGLGGLGMSLAMNIVPSEQILLLHFTVAPSAMSSPASGNSCRQGAVLVGLGELKRSPHGPTCRRTLQEGDAQYSADAFEDVDRG